MAICSHSQIREDRFVKSHSARVRLPQLVSVSHNLDDFYLTHLQLCSIIQWWVASGVGHRASCSDTVQFEEWFLVLMLSLGTFSRAQPFTAGYYCLFIPLLYSHRLTIELHTERKGPQSIYKVVIGMCSHAEVEEN